MAEIAKRQGGTAATWQLRLAGVTAASQRRRVAAGRLHPLLRGVVAVGHPGITREGWWHAALLVAGPGSALSHITAGQARSLVTSSMPFPIHVTVPGARGRARQDRLRIHSGHLHPEDVVTFNGLRITSPARTLLDLAEILTLDELVTTLDRAEALRLHHPAALKATIARAHGRRGRRRLREALLITRPQHVLTRSKLEREALALARRHGLPPPEPNARIHGYEADLLWRDAGLVVELDSRAHHGDAIALDRDHRRDANLQAHGLRVLRFTWRQVLHDDAWVAARIAALLSRTAR
ncbi:MAG TPA: DUF559 domain-containing protein [Capillimicrobium sp.]